MTLFLTITLSLMMGYVSRMCGGAKPHLPLGLEQWVYALPYLLAGLLTTWAGAVLAYAGAVLGKRTGHGRALDYGTNQLDEKADPEKLEILTLWMKDKVSDYWYDFTLMTITGLATALFLGILVMIYVSVPMGLLILLGGALKGVAYSIGWAIWPNNAPWYPDKDAEDYEYNVFADEFSEPTQIGEFLTGFFAGLPLMYLIVTRWDEILKFSIDLF